jgi:type I restriction enzyme, S subunit
MSWESTKLSEFLSERDGRIKYEKANQLGLQRIKKIDFSGNIHLSQETDSKTDMIRVKSGDLVISGINAAKGAIAVHAEEDDVLATIHYSAYEFNADRISVDFLKWFFKSPEFTDLLREQIPGGIKTELKPKHILPLEVKLPKLADQLSISERLNRFHLKQLQLEHEITHQQSLLSKLKQAILQEAIQGKLTVDWRTANPDTEPASKLLKEIAEARDKWIKAAKALGDDEAKTIERKLIKLKAAPAAKPIEGLPTSWEWATLIEANLLIVDCHNKTAPYQSSGIPIIRTTNVRNGKLDLAHTKHISEQTYQRWSARCIPLPGDLIFTREAPVGEVGQIPEGARVCLGQRTMLIRPMPQYVMPPYLLLAIQAPEFMQRASRVKRGAMVGHLRVGDVETAHIPLPPIAEQAAIVERVEALMETCRELETEIENSRSHADQLLQAVLKEAFAPAS